MILQHVILQANMYIEGNESTTSNHTRGPNWSRTSHRCILRLGLGHYQVEAVVGSNHPADPGQPDYNHAAGVVVAAAAVAADEDDSLPLGHALQTHAASGCWAG